MRVDNADYDLSNTSLTYRAYQFDLEATSAEVPENMNPFDWVTLYDANDSALVLSTTGEDFDADGHPMKCEYNCDDYIATVEWSSIEKNNEDSQLSINFKITVQDKAMKGMTTGYVKKLTFNINQNIDDTNSKMQDADAAESEGTTTKTDTQSSSAQSGVQGTANTKNQSQTTTSQSSATGIAQQSSIKETTTNNVSNGSATNSVASSASATQHVHTWKAHTASKWVEDTAAYDEQVVETAAYDERVKTHTYEVCLVCGLELEEDANGSCPDMDTHLAFDHGDVGGGYTVRDEYETVHHDATYKTVHHDATGHYEDYIDYYYCECGATK